MNRRQSMASGTGTSKSTEEETGPHPLELIAMADKVRSIANTQQMLVPVVYRGAPEFAWREHKESRTTLSQKAANPN